MSLLTPLYILGALAIAAPIVFHLIRRTPRGEVPFSSLMFLSPTPPRLTRRSRLDNILLLLLRAAALGLLALAFARPFLREPAHGQEKISSPLRIDPGCPKDEMPASGGGYALLPLELRQAVGAEWIRRIVLRVRTGFLAIEDVVSRVMQQ